MSSNEAGRLLDVRGLTVEYRRGPLTPPFRAVDGVDLAIDRGETVGLVGESGSGKSTIGRAILGLTPISAGTVAFAGSDITHGGQRMRRALSTEMQVVFQDPYSSLNPTRTIGRTLAEMLRVHGKLPGREVERRVREIVERVGLPADAVGRYPAQFSGGQRQRIAIARALIGRPRLLICDEPVSALDLSVQAQVLNLLRELQDEMHVGYLFVAHDLGVVRYLSHRIVVLYRGSVMEQGDATAVYETPAHPYTRALLEAAPSPDPDVQRQRRAARHRVRVEGDERAISDGCEFAPRCPFAVDRCRVERPALEATPQRSLVACHRWRELLPERSTHATVPLRGGALSSPGGARPLDEAAGH